MTVAPALTCGVCASSLSGQEERCPSCGSPTATAQPAAHGPLPTLLAGCARASGGARALAVVVDVLAAGALAAGTLLEPALGWGAVSVFVVATVVALALTGRTLGGLVAGLRTVDLFAGTPLHGRVLSAWRGDAVTLDVRGARDPLRSAGTAVPRPAPPRPTAPAAPAAVPPPSASRTTAAPQPFAPGPAAPAPGPPAPAPGPAAPAPGPAAPAPGPVPPAPHPHAGQPATPAAAPVEATVAHVPTPARRAAAPAAPPGRIAVVTPDGAHIAVAGRALLGRNPQPRPEEEGATLVPLADLERTVSKTHAALRWDGRTAWLTDRGSTNGTVVTDTTGASRRLEAHVEAPVELGSTVHLGDLAVTITGEGATR